MSEPTLDLDDMRARLRHFGLDGLSRPQVESLIDMAERIPELERLVAEYRQDHLERVEEARGYRQRAERVEAAARPVAAHGLGGSDLDEWMSDVLNLRAALAAAPAEERDARE